MAWSAVGTWHGSHNANLSLSNQAVGNLLVVEVLNFSNSTVWATGLTGGGATWVQAGVKFSGTTNPFSGAVFLGTVTATGAQTATPTWSGTAPGSFSLAGQEFSSTVGAWQFDKQGNLDSAGTTDWASLTATFGAGELYFGFAADATAAVAGSTSGYVYNADVDSVQNGAAYNVNCPGSATFPVWGDGGQQFGIMILVNEASGGAPMPTMVASDKWFARYKRGRRAKPRWLDIPAPQPQAQPPTFFPQPAYPRRVAVPAMVRRRMQPVPALGIPEDWPQIRRQQVTLARRPRTQFPITVAAPVVAQPVIATGRPRPTALSPARRRMYRVPSVAPIEDWPQIRRPAPPVIRRRPQTMPLYLQVSGPLPAISARPTRRSAISPRRARMASLPPGVPLAPSSRPARRFVAYPPRASRRQLSLSAPVPFFGKRFVVALPRIGKRQAQLVPSVVVVSQPTVQQQTLARKATWFGIRQRRAPQLQITGAAPPLAVAPITGVPPKPRLSGFRPKRTMPVRPFFPVLLVNDAEEGTNGVTVSTANSGGVGENAFDAVTIVGGSTMTYDNTHAAHGALAFKVTTSAAGESSIDKWIASSAGPQQQVWFRAYCYAPTGSAAWRIYGGRSGGGSAGSVLLTGGVLQIQNSAFGGTVSFTTRPNKDAWFRIEGYIIGHPTQGQISVSLFNNPDGIIPHETQTTIVGYSTAGNLTEHWFGQSATAGASGPFWMDDIGISNTGPLGPVGQESILPSWLRPRTIPASRIRVRRPAQIMPLDTAVPSQRRSVLRGAGLRRQRTTPRTSAIPAPPVQTPARRRFGPPRSRPQAQFVQPPVLAKPPPLRMFGARPRLTMFLRRLLRRSLNIFGAPPPITVFVPGCVKITNVQVCGVFLSQAAPVVALGDLPVGGVLIGDASGAVAVTNAEVGMVTVSASTCGPATTSHELLDENSIFIRDESGLEIEDEG